MRLLALLLLCVSLAPLAQAYDPAPPPDGLARLVFYRDTHSHLYQKLLIVDGIEDGRFVSAYFIHPDGTRTNHELKVGEFGRIGRSIV